MTPAEAEEEVHRAAEYLRCMLDGKPELGDLPYIDLAQQVAIDVQAEIDRHLHAFPTVESQDAMADLMEFYATRMAAAAASQLRGVAAIAVAVLRELGKARSSSPQDALASLPPLR